MLPSVKPDLVVFDFAETLTDQSAVVDFAWKQMLEKSGVDASHPTLKRALKKSAQFHGVKKRLQSLQRDVQKVVGADSARCLDWLRAVDDFYAQGGQQSLYPSAVDFVTDLHANGVRCFVVSNDPERGVRPVLQAHGIEDYFQHIYGSATDHGNSKDGFFNQIQNEAAEKLGRHPQCWFIGDRPTDFPPRRKDDPREGFIHRIAVSEVSDAYKERSEKTGPVYVIQGGYPQARQELAALLKPNSLTAQPDLE